MELFVEIPSSKNARALGFAFTSLGARLQRAPHGSNFTRIRLDKDTNRLIVHIHDHLRDVTNVWRHFKGAEYEMIGNGLHTETNEQLVVYRNANGELFARPMAMFYGKNEQGVQRFERVIQDEL